MSDVVLVGLMSLAGTVIGTISGAIATQSLTSYKIEQLQKAVDKHNSLVERTYKLEKDMGTVFIRVDEVRDDVKDTRESVKELRDDMKEMRSDLDKLAS